MISSLSPPTLCGTAFSVTGAIEVHVVRRVSPAFHSPCVGVCVLCVCLSLSFNFQGFAFLNCKNKGHVPTWIWCLTLKASISKPTMRKPAKEMK